eukprot:14779374-Heterocapsa_arctica.AAC.1
MTLAGLPLAVSLLAYRQPRHNGRALAGLGHACHRVAPRTGRRLPSWALPSRPGDDLNNSI